MKQVSLRKSGWTRQSSKFTGVALKKVWSRSRTKVNWEVNFSLIVILVTLSAALLAPFIAPRDPYAQKLTARLEGPSKYHILGTDALGRDIFSRLIYGARLSLSVAVAGTLGSIGLGTTLGLLAARYGGWLDQIISGAINIQLSLPFMLLAVTLIAVTEPGVATIIWILIITGWAGHARIMRAQALKLNEANFIEAARAMGQKEHLILWKHYLPNLFNQLIVLGSMNIARFIILESSLSFLGLGLDPSVPTWGSMAADGREYLATHWWLSTFPGLAVFSVSLSLNTIGDWLQKRIH